MSIVPTGRLDVRLEMNGTRVWMMMKFEPAPGSGLVSWTQIESYLTWGAAMECVELKVKNLPGVDLALDDKT